MTKTTRKLDFTDKVGVVTGGAQGIGRGVVETFAALGADVVIGDVAIDKAEDTARTVSEQHDAVVEAVETDVSKYPDAQELVDASLNNFGRLDILVNNAGLTETKPFLETSPEEWKYWVDVCFFGTMNCMHAVLPTLQRQGSGAIINFASGSYKGNDPGLAVYGAAKAANVSLTRTVAHEVGKDGIRVNCIAPGTTETPASEDFIEEYGDTLVENSYALDRLGRPTDIADAVAFLASDAADWITGETLHVDGGYIRG